LQKGNHRYLKDASKIDDFSQVVALQLRDLLKSFVQRRSVPGSDIRAGLQRIRPRKSRGLELGVNDGVQEAALGGGDVPGEVDSGLGVRIRTIAASFRRQGRENRFRRTAFVPGKRQENLLEPEFGLVRSQSNHHQFLRYFTVMSIPQGTVNTAEGTGKQARRSACGCSAGKLHPGARNSIQCVAAFPYAAPFSLRSAADGVCARECGKRNARLHPRRREPKRKRRSNPFCAMSTRRKVPQSRPAGRSASWEIRDWGYARSRRRSKRSTSRPGRFWPSVAENSAAGREREIPPATR